MKFEITTNIIVEFLLFIITKVSSAAISTYFHEDEYFKVLRSRTEQELVDIREQIYPEQPDVP